MLGYNIELKHLMNPLIFLRAEGISTHSVRFAWMQIARAPFHQDDDNGVEIVR